MTTSVDANPQVTSSQNTDTQNVQSTQDTSCNNSSCACGSSSSSSSSSTGLAAMMEYTLCSLSVNNDAAAAIGEAGTLVETVSTKNAMDQLDGAESGVKGMEGTRSHTHRQGNPHHSDMCDCHIRHSDMRG